MDPMAPSTNGFCQGERGAVTASSMPMTLTLARTTAPYTLSRSLEQLPDLVPKAAFAVAVGLVCVVDECVDEQHQVGRLELEAKFARQPPSRSITWVTTL